MLLYLHVPFCRVKCAYCGFFSQPLGQGPAAAEAVDRYVDRLLDEIGLWSKRLGGVGVETVFFGGGTPSLLRADQVSALLERVRAAFDLRPGAEVTMEANPESALAPGWLPGVRQAGINRLSLGVQSLDDPSLALLGRVHSARQAGQAVDAARAAGFGKVSLDLMWGLPGRNNGQSQVDWMRQLRMALELEPDHISAYGLTLEEGTSLAMDCQEGRLVLPGEKEQASMFLAGADLLEANGLMQYEISNFARMGMECRHNLGYWDGISYLGLGPSAVSTLGNRRWANPAGIGAWEKAVVEGSVGRDYEPLDQDTRQREKIMLRLRTIRGLSLDEWQELTGQAFLKTFGSLVSALRKNDLAVIRNGRFRLTRTGMLVSNTIIARFFDHWG